MKVKDGHTATKEGISYLEVKHMLQLSYCQSIVFYLLLKAEARSVRDHPVIPRLLELRTSLERVSKLSTYATQVRSDRLLRFETSPPLSFWLVLFFKFWLMNGTVLQSLVVFKFDLWSWRCILFAAINLLHEVDLANWLLLLGSFVQLMKNCNLKYKSCWMPDMHQYWTVQTVKKMVQRRCKALDTVPCMGFFSRVAREHRIEGINLQL